jgi:hypothetical protein
VKWLLPGGFLVRGKVKVGAEVSLAHFGCNLKRALAVVGLEKLLAALRNFRPGGRPSAAVTPAPAALGVNATGALAALRTVWRRGTEGGAAAGTFLAPA